MKKSVRKGLPGGQYRPLDRDGVQQIHDTAMRVFEEIGVKVAHAGARELFRNAGATVDDETQVVKIKRSLVKELVARAPSVIHLCGRDETGNHDLEIGGKKVYMGTGGTALNVQEPGSPDNRRAVLADIPDMARMVEALDNIHFYMLNIYPDDLEVEEVDVNRFGAALNRTEKHIMGGVYTVDGVRNVVRMAEKIAGSPEALRQRPFISMVTCVISPYVVDEHYGELIIEVARQGIPVVVPSEPLCGATSPITLASNIVVNTVDSLAGVMLTQLANKNTPVLFGCISSITDLREMKYLAGAVEMGLMNAAAAQMAQFYELPFYATGGMSDAKVVDAQAGYESALTGALVALAGANFIHDAAGFLEFCLTASYDKLVLDDEIIGNVMRAVQGIQVNKKTLAFDELQKAGPGGHFVLSRHTRRHMRNEQFMPQLGDREVRDTWKEQGALDAAARAAARAKKILKAKPKNILAEDTREWIKKEIPGIRDFLME